ncbi:hydrogenase formation protein HypD [Thioalkalicoccus limnaeus]|uniref:Hydrogenase maturation factor n=1 Tax=Thioalkalicoccus limnaeus TaxID=120681 RepID=A0ABV4BGQ1_9GAMM
MRYVDEFRDQDLARGLAAAIAAAVEPDREYRLMEFCGGHTHAVFRHGIPDLMPSNLRFLHGPGCPVCVLPMARLDQAIRLALEHPVTLCTYGDLLRVPATGGQTLFKAKAAGADVRLIYSTQDALALARRDPDRQVVFLAIGFETTTPPTAVAIETARAEGLANFSVLCNHVLTPPALRAILASQDSGGLRIDGILGPSHVSTLIGSEAYRFVPDEFGLPIVIAGFEPLDVMHATLMLVDQINRGPVRVDNQYRRAVTASGNAKALALMAEVFTRRAAFEWRGLGVLPDSALAIAEPYADFDAERCFAVRVAPGREVKGCDCASVLRGVKTPTDCRLFGRVCTPDNPLGACMVSSEGACAAYWSYGRFRGAGATGQVA